MKMQKDSWRIWEVQILNDYISWDSRFHIQRYIPHSFLGDYYTSHKRRKPLVCYLLPVHQKPKVDKSFPSDSDWAIRPSSNKNVSPDFAGMATFVIFLFYQLTRNEHCFKNIFQDVNLYILVLNEEICTQLLLWYEQTLQGQANTTHACIGIIHAVFSLEAHYDQLPVEVFQYYFVSSYRTTKHLYQQQS